jgi:glycosyltransferase involved in cell wall biosynthesis
MPAVAVVIPAYNGGQRLREAVASVRAQTFTDYELIVVDDGGSEDLSNLDARVVRQPNGGVSSARNLAAEVTSGAVLAYLDQDDRWLPDKLERQMAAFPADAVCSLTDFLWMPAGVPAVHPHPVTRLSLLRGGHFCLSTLAVRRAALERAGGFDTTLDMIQDWELLLRLLRFGPAAHVSEPLVEYVVHDSNQSRDHRRGYQERMRVLRTVRAAEERAAARAGRQDTRRLYGAQAWSAFVSDRRPTDAALALAWSPAAVARGLAAKVTQR